MVGKLEGNGLWESSRMILPEHKEAYLQFNQELKRKERQELDEQERERISTAIQGSLRHRKSVTLRLFDPLEDLQVIGVVERIDSHLMRLKVDGEWFRIEDITGAEEMGCMNND